MMPLGLEGNDLTNLGTACIAALLLLKETVNVIKASKNKESQKSLQKSITPEDAPDFWLLQKGISEGVDKLIKIEDKESEILHHITQLVQLNTEYLKLIQEKQNAKSRGH